MMYWQKEIETMDRKDLVKLQLERLKQTIEWRVTPLLP